MLCPPRAALGIQGVLPPSVPPLCATTTGCTTAVCHDLCHDHGHVPRPPCPSSSSQGQSLHNPPLSGPRHRLCFVSPTQRGCAERGARGGGCQLPTRGSRVALLVSPVLPGGPAVPGPSAGHPVSAGGPREELPSLTQKVLMWQSLARSHWSRSALQGPPPTGRPRRPPESPRRSRVASPSPAPACCRSPSADVSEAPSWGPCLCLRFPALSLGCLPGPESLLSAHGVSCLSPVLCHPLESPSCPWGPLTLLRSPASLQPVMASPSPSYL